MAANSMYMMQRQAASGSNNGVNQMANGCVCGGVQANAAKSLRGHDCGYQRAPCRIWPLPFFNGAVEAGGGATIIANPQYPFIAELLVVERLNELDPALDGGRPIFLITNIEVATQGQMLQRNPMSADVFAPDSANNILNLDPADGGIDISINVVNTSAVEARFSAVMFGGTTAGRG